MLSRASPHITPRIQLIRRWMQIAQALAASIGRSHQVEVVVLRGSGTSVTLKVTLGELPA